MLQTRNFADACYEGFSFGRPRQFLCPGSGILFPRRGACLRRRLAATIVSGYDGESVREIARLLGKRRACRKKMSVGADAGFLRLKLRGQDSG